MTEDTTAAQPLDELLARVAAAGNPYEQQRFRDAVIAHGASAINAIAGRGMLCDQRTALFGSQMVREIGRSHREHALGALREALQCGTEATWRHVIAAAHDLGADLPRPVGRLVPSYMDPDHTYHLLADRCPDTGTRLGDIYLSECGWVFTGEWLKQNIGRLNPDHQKPCGNCTSAMVRSR